MRSKTSHSYARTATFLCMRIPPLPTCVLPPSLAARTAKLKASPDLRRHKAPPSKKGYPTSEQAKASCHSYTYPIPPLNHPEPFRHLHPPDHRNPCPASQPAIIRYNPPQPPPFPPNQKKTPQNPNRITIPPPKTPPSPPLQSRLITLKLLLGFSSTPTKLGSTPLIKSSALDPASLFAPPLGIKPIPLGTLAYPELPMAELVARALLRSESPLGARSDSARGKSQRRDFSARAPSVPVAARCAMATWDL